MDQYREWIELAAQGIEVLAVAIMVLFIIIGTLRWVFHSAKKVAGTYERYRVVLGKTLLVGLELLVAADIINTVAIDTTPESLAMLGGLVVVRTFLGWSVTVEVEGHWPWQKAKESDSRLVGEAPQASAPYGEKAPVGESEADRKG